ncbi:MAG: WD40/YVTN/BNR-like repeat-containing protein, partial [Armatimonadota bacterium]
MLLLATKTGLLCLDDEGNEAFRALTDRWVRHLAFDADGRLLAIVDDHLVMGRPLPDDAGDDANWSTLGAVSDLTANCVGDSGDAIFVGAADARMFVLRGRGAGPAQRVAAFDRVEGRDAWDTPWGGPPDVRSLAFIRDPDRPAVYADIHVGGIARSFDRGQTWSPARGRLHRDVHQVATHPDLPDSVFAATQQGFFRSDDRGESWSVALEPFLP